MNVLAAPLNATLLIMLVIGVWTDVRSRRIPNALTLGGLALALAIRGTLGLGVLGEGLAGAAIAVGLMVPLFAMGGFGGGDAKLLVAVGGFLGPIDFMVALLATAIAGGLLSLGYSARRGVVLPALLSTRALMAHTVTGGRSGEAVRLDLGAASVPYALAIAAGTMFALWYGAAA